MGLAFKNRTLKFIKNKYTIVVLIFFIWTMFLDKNNYYSTLTLKEEIRNLNKDKAYYEMKIFEDSTKYAELQSNKEMLEKFAREQYFMKKPDEDIYVIVKTDD